MQLESDMQEIATVNNLYVPEGKNYLVVNFELSSGVNGAIYIAGTLEKLKDFGIETNGINTITINDQDFIGKKYRITWHWRTWPGKSELVTRQVTKVEKVSE